MKGLKSNLLADVFRWFCLMVSNKLDENELRAVAYLVFSDILKVSKADIMVGKDLRVSESDIVNLYRVAIKLNDNMPVQQALGKAWFGDLELIVNGNVLIPRPETEELVEWIKNDFPLHTGKSPETIWDIGTGSGAIAISLACAFMQAEVIATDISHDALHLAERNAEKYHCRIRFLEQDILQLMHPDACFDFIVSNPPYVMEAEKELMKPNVLQFEPALALFVPNDDPLKYYRAIAQVAKQVLNKGGILYLEINEKLGSETIRLLQNMGFGHAMVRKDMFGKDRFVKAWE